MKKIFLCCAAGMSTSMVVNKMKQAAMQKGIAAEIIAVAMEQGASTLCSLINQRTIEHDNRHSNLLSSVYFVGLAHRIHSA